MRSIFYLIITVAFFGCALPNQPSFNEKPDDSWIIKAEPSVVWNVLQKVIKNEKDLRIVSMDSQNLSMAIDKGFSFWSWGDRIKIKLIPHENQTLFSGSVRPKAQLLNFGSEVILREIFNSVSVQIN